MDVVKKYQYSLVLFVISGAIFLSGVVPYGGSLFHLYAIAPDDYVLVTAVVLAVEETSQTQEMYRISVGFSLENQESGAWEEHISAFDSPISTLEEGMGLSVFCYVPEPDYVFQEWYLWRQCFIFLGFSVMGFFTGMMMMNPVTVVSKARKPRTLRERLEQY